NERDEGNDDGGANDDVAVVLRLLREWADAAGGLQERQRQADNRIRSLRNRRANVDELAGALGFAFEALTAARREATAQDVPETARDTVSQAEAGTWRGPLEALAHRLAQWNEVVARVDERSRRGRRVTFEGDLPPSNATTPQPYAMELAQL